MANNTSLFSLETEQAVLGSLLQFPETYPEISWLNSKDFSKVNSPIFSVIQQIIESKGRPDTVLVAERLKSIGISIDGIDVTTYCQTLSSLTTVDPKNVVDLAKSLKLKTLKRRMLENCDSLKKEIMTGEKSGVELVGLKDKFLGDSLLAISGVENTGTNLFETLENDVEARANAGANTDFIVHPYPSYSKYLGNFKLKEMYCIVSRRGTGKSLVLMDIALSVQAVNKEPISVLYLDTEMDISEFQKRACSSQTGVPYYLMDSNLWRYDAVWCPKVRLWFKELKTKEKNIWFEPVGNRSISNICSLIKSWKLKQGRERKCLVILDQFKVSSKTKAEAGNSKEYETAYFGTEALKDVAIDTGCVMLFALQSNIQGVFKGKSSEEINDTDSVAALSDRISFLLNHMLILRGRTYDEVLNDTTPTEPAPTHKLIHLKVRNGGEGWPEYDKWVKMKIGKDIKYLPNFINLNLSNFKVQDSGLFSEMLIKQGRVSAPINKIDPTAAINI